MSNGESYLLWSGMDERLVVEEMMRDSDSKHWEECSKFVKRCVYAKAKNIPSNLQEDIIQEVMYKVTKYLPHFRFQCTLKTWLNSIIVHYIIDTHRKLKNERQIHSTLADPSNENEREGEGFQENEVMSTEHVFEANDELRNGVAALLEYANTHSNPVRNRLIIRMVILEGQTHAEAAKAAGCHTPVVGYVVREAQRYAREKMEHRL